MASHRRSKYRNFLIFKTLKATWKRRQKLQNIVAMLLMRQQTLTVLPLISLILYSSTKIATRMPRIRTCRRKLRKTGWWESVWNSYSERRFKKTFRISKATFSYILDRIKADIQPKHPGQWGFAEKPISPACRLGITLYRLARGDYYYTISEMTGFGVATVCNITIEVSQVIVEKLWKEAVSNKFPSTLDDFKDCLLDMEEMWQFPLAFSALDGCHIPIKMPRGGGHSAKEYHNFKNFYSVVLMGMVNAKMQFIWASVGCPGSNHDSIIFRSTSVYSKFMESNILPTFTKLIEGVKVPFMILADSAFPHLPWIQKPYTNAVLSEKQRYFNYRLSRARMVVESAYGILKSRWRVLHRRCDSNNETMKVKTLACIVLHNLCIDHGKNMPKNLDLTVNPENPSQRRPRDIIRNLLHMTRSHPIRSTTRSATKIRKALTEKFWKEHETGVVV